MRPPQPVGTKEIKALSQLLKQTQNRADYRRVQCMWLRAALGLPALSVARAVGWSPSRVRHVQARYFREGAASLIGKGRGGRRRENLSVEAEQKLLGSFLEKAQAGEVLVVSEIQSSYEEAVGRRVPKSTVYRMLSRHGWRKIAPRPRHPKSNPEAAAAFKKNSRS